MRKQGLIEPVQKWHAKTQTLNLNGRILAKLRTKGLSFDRWSIGWGFATVEAEELLAVAVIGPGPKDALDAIILNAKVARQIDRLKKAMQFAQQNYD